MLVSIALASCTSPVAETKNDAFVTMLGTDTLAVEVLEKTANGMNVKVVLRSPQTQLTSYKLLTDQHGGVQEMTARRYEHEIGFKGNGIFHHSLTREGDFYKVHMMTRSGDQRSFMVDFEEGTLPFIDMVHWPFELAIKRAHAANEDTLIQPLISGNRISMFTIARIDKDSMSIRHPYRGVMGMRINDDNELEFLDAGHTTRKLKVHRTSGIDIDAVAMKYIEQDKNGSPFGSLSSAETMEFEISDAEFRVEYGSPKRRGRDLFGGIVPFGEIWRTGANRASHFYTSKDIRIGNLEVPAGEYTLFSIPDKNGGSLIINKQTGQNGRAYDESRDLGRTPMQVRTKDDSTEDFTIQIQENASGAELQLIWGNTVYYTQMHF